MEVRGGSIEVREGLRGGPWRLHGGLDGASMEAPTEPPWTPMEASMEPQRLVNISRSLSNN